MAVVTVNITHAPTPAHAGTDCARQVYARSTYQKSGALRGSRYLSEYPPATNA